MGSDISYGDALEQIGISTLAHTRRDMCNKIFNYIVNNPNHKLYNLLLISNNKFGISFTRLYNSISWFSTQCNSVISWNIGISIKLSLLKLLLLLSNSTHELVPANAKYLRFFRPIYTIQEEELECVPEV